MNKLINNASNKTVGIGLLLVAAFYTAIVFVVGGVILSGVATVTLIPLSLLVTFLVIGSGLLVAAAVTNLFEG